MGSELEQGLTFLQEKKYVEALALLLPYAEQGESQAQAAVGLLYQVGLGTERNIPLSIKWLTVAAEQGCGEAAHNLGTVYLTCEPDMPVSKEMSRYWYRRAKDLDFVVAPSDWYEE